jgi:hypothetical protein
MSLRDLFFQNFWLKLFSVASGTVIWLAIHYSIQSDYALAEQGSGRMLVKQTIMVPVLVMAQSRESGLVPIANTGVNHAFKITPPDVQITVFVAPALAAQERQKIRVFVDLTDFHSRLPVQEDLHQDVPSDVDVLDLNPRTVTVEPITP